MRIRPIPPVTPEDKQIEHIMTQLEMYRDLSNCEKSTLAEYVEELEDALRACIEIADLHGWDGVNNSKILHVFLDAELNERRGSTATRCAQIADEHAMEMDKIVAALRADGNSGTHHKSAWESARQIARNIRSEFGLTSELCPWCNTLASEASQQHEGPHTTWCPHYRKAALNT